MVLVVLFPGWSGSNPKQSFSLLKRCLEKIPGVKVEIIDYLGINGPFKKLRTKSSIEELANNAEKELLLLKKEKVVAIGYSLGAIILRLLIERGYEFEECVFAGGPHKGFRNKYWQYPLALLLGIKPFFELMPESDFIKSLKKLPPGTYIGSKIDEKVELKSAVPAISRKKIFLWNCGHNMFPRKEKGAPKSAIPVVAKIIEEYVKKSQ